MTVLSTLSGWSVKVDCGLYQPLCASFQFVAEDGLRRGPKQSSYGSRIPNGRPTNAGAQHRGHHAPAAKTNTHRLARKNTGKYTA